MSKEGQALGNRNTEAVRKEISIQIQRHDVPGFIKRQVILRRKVIRLTIFLYILPGIGKIQNRGNACRCNQRIGISGTPVLVIDRRCGSVQLSFSNAANRDLTEVGIRHVIGIVGAVIAVLQCAKLLKCQHSCFFHHGDLDGIPHGNTRFDIKFTVVNADCHVGFGLQSAKHHVTGIDVIPVIKRHICLIGAKAHRYDIAKLVSGCGKSGCGDIQHGMTVLFNFNHGDANRVRFVGRIFRLRTRTQLQ